MLGTWVRASSHGDRDGTKLQLHLAEAIDLAFPSAQRGPESRWRLGLALAACALCALPLCPPSVLLHTPSGEEIGFGVRDRRCGYRKNNNLKLSSIFGHLIFLHHLTIFRLPAAGHQFLICCMSSQQR